MDQHNIDRLFREKMDSLEVTPAANSWSQVEKRLKPTRKPTYYWVAAAVALFVISWILVPNHGSLDKQITNIKITHPPLQESEGFEIPVAIALKESKEFHKKAHSQVTKRVLATSAKQPISKLQEPKEDLSVFQELESKTTVIAEVSETIGTLVIEEPSVEPVDNNRESVRNIVKITYIASNNREPVAEVTNTSDSTSRFKKLIAFAEKIDPGEMLADIKTAKDNLLNGGLKSKKDKNFMNP